MSKELLRIKVLIGFKCNQQCIYCDNPKNIDADFTKFPQVKNFINNLQDKYDILLEVDGGESLYYLELLKKLLSLNVKTYIFTNGTLINEDILQYIHKKVTFRISLDGVKTLHLLQRPQNDRENSFDNTIRGIHLLQQYNIPFIIASTITDLSVGFLNQSKDLILGLNPERWILTVQVFKSSDNKNISFKTQHIYEKVLPVVSQWNDDRISFHSFHLKSNNPEPNKEILFKENLIQVNIEGFNTPTLEIYDYSNLDSLLNKLKEK